MEKRLPDILANIVWFLLALLVCAWLIVSVARAGEVPLETIVEPSRLYLEANVPHYYFNPKIDCLIRLESGGNPDAIGDNGKAIGILQFHRPTFQQFCVEKYGLTNDIWSVRVQKACCHNMIRDGYYKHWSTWDKCN